MGSGSHTHQELELEAATLQQQPSSHDGHHQHGADGAATSESPRDSAFECKSGQDASLVALVARGSWFGKGVVPCRSGLQQQLMRIGDWLGCE